MDKIRIGIVAGRTIEKGRPFKDKLSFVNNFTKRIDECGAIPYGVLFPDGKFKEEYLDIYDGFFFHSGPHIHSYQLMILHYAITNNKPVLGICLGSQVIGTYSYVIDNLKNQNKEVNYENIFDFFEPIKDQENLYMNKVKGHDPCPKFYEKNIEDSKHEIILEENSIIYDIFKTKKIKMPSLHKWVLKNSGQEFKTTGISNDGLIEVVEYKNKDKFILGVQFHAELEEKNLILFKRFIEEVKKRK